MASTGEVELIVASPRNKENLDDLLKALEGGAALIPFVGAGLSRPFEFPEWGAFLRAHADEAGVKDLVDTRLSKGEYEEAAEDLQQALGDLAFEDAIRRAFGPRDITAVLPDSAVAALPALATGPVLTTNFDNVLETAFKEAGADFEQVVCGARLGPIAQALHSNTRILWKLHGDVKDNTDRVLTNSEYAKHYGHSDPAQFDWLQPLPHAFESLLSARAVLFLGCSLEQDRTVRILRAFAQRRRGVGHYALLEDPGDDARRRERARAMSNVGVRPLWFPQKRFGLIRPFLAFLASRAPGTNNRTRIASQRARIERGIEEQRNVAADAAAPSSAEPQPVVGQAPDRPERFYGRASTLQEVAGHLASASVRLVNIHGPRGIGKTALAAHLLAGIEAGRWPEDAAGPQVDGIAYLSTRTEGITLERIYFAAARMLGGDTRGALERDWKKEQLTTEDKIRQLLDALCAGCQVFLLDHFEDLLDGDGRITDAGVRTLVERSVESRCPARFIVTSGIRLAVSPRATKLSQWVPLHDGLELDDGVAMLRDVDRGSELKKLKDETLKGVVTRLHGVPRALEVFAGILADETENLDGLLERFYDRTDGVDDLFQEGINRLDLQSKRVIEALAVLGQPVPQVAIDFMLQPFEPGLDLPAVLRRLNRGNMVRMADREKGTWALHPIDQDFAYARCPETGRYSRQALHHRAAEWYASIRTPRQMWNTLEGVDPLLREFDHRVKAGLYDDAAVVLAEFDEEFRGRVGQAARSLAMHLQVEGHITIDRVRLADTIGRAHSYRHVGPIEKAIDDYRDALVMARAQGNAAAEIESLGWIGESFRRLARPDEGVVSVREAVDISRRIGDRHRVARWLGELALTNCYRGELKEALAAAEEANRTAVEVGAVVWEALSLDALALVHLARGEYVKAIQAAERTLEMYGNGVWEHTVIYVLNVMGLASLELHQHKEAVDYLSRAWAESRISEDVRVEGLTQYNLAHVYWTRTEFDRALAAAEEAVKTFTRTGGGELPAAEAFAQALNARATGLPGAEARALVAAARASMYNPDLRHPRSILTEAVRLARETNQADLGAEAEAILAALAERDTRATAVT
jgi:tetratricopeptide (TPR) repeat protein